MSDWTPCVIKIEKIIKHPNADNLSIATVLGDYPIVVRTGEYEEGQLAIYIPVDSITPDVEKYHFLSPKQYERYEENGETKQRMIGYKYPVGSVPERYRVIKAKKILGAYSQGLLEPLLPGLSLGDSVIDFLGLKKWEEPDEEDNLPHVKMRGSNAEKAPSGWSIPKYDIDGIRKYLECLQEGEEICLSEKLHGSNSAFTHDGTRLWVRSRNWFKKLDPRDPWWDIAIRYDLENKLSKFPMMTFFGELYGLVKGFSYDTEVVGGKRQSKIRFFDVYDVKQMKYLDYDDRLSIIREVGLYSVPELYRGPWLGKEHAYPYAEGQSTLNPKHIREGTVLVPTKERYEPRLDGRLLLKIIGEGYNLQK